MLFRDQARRLIAAKYFTGAERTALCTLLDIPVPTESQMLRETAALEQSAAVEQGREARFRLTVIPAYNYTCALTGCRLVTVTSGGIVDAAHIHQFAAPALFPGFAPTLDSGHWTLDNSTRPGPILDSNG